MYQLSGKERGGQRTFFTDGGKFAFTSEVPALIYAFDVQGSLNLAASASGVATLQRLQY